MRKYFVGRSLDDALERLGFTTKNQAIEEMEKLRSLFHGLKNNEVHIFVGEFNVYNPGTDTDYETE